MSKDLKKNFEQIKKLLIKNSQGLEVRKEMYNSQAKEKKPQLHLYGKKEVRIAKSPFKQAFIFGVIQQKNFVGFYSMPIYSHRQEFKIKNDELSKSLKGKSCFNIKKLTPEMLKEIDSIIKKGIALYKKEKWI